MSFLAVAVDDFEERLRRLERKARSTVAALARGTKRTATQESGKASTPAPVSRRRSGSRGWRKFERLTWRSWRGMQTVVIALLMLFLVVVLVGFAVTEIVKAS